MFEQSFIDAVAAKVADVVLARLNRPAIEKRYMSVEEAASYAGYSKDALWKHIQRGHLPVSRQGQSVRVDKREIDKWMIRNRQ
jgi:excisionase family DNA binding protein